MTPHQPSAAEEYLEERYAPLLSILRRQVDVCWMLMGPTDYGLRCPRQRVAITCGGQPLPDALEDVRQWLVVGPEGKQEVPLRLPVLLLAADLLQAVRKVSETD